MKTIISLIILLLVIMDPLGNLPIFISILKNFSSSRRYFIIIREMIIALFFMLLFLFFGENILSILNLHTPIVSISGGIVLFLISIKMIFPKKKINQNSKSKTYQEEPFLVPLAIPLIAGPSLLATLMLLSHQYSLQIWYLLLSLIISWIISMIILLSSEFFLRILGNQGVNALERLMGLVLIMISTQMFLNGINDWFKI